jgi:AcrR family transcriptional regulator
VIEAALDLLGDAGYGGTSIDAISRRSGVARTTIYRHWRSLAEIVHEAAMTTVGVKAVPTRGMPVPISEPTSASSPRS